MKWCWTSMDMHKMWKKIIFVLLITCLIFVVEAEKAQCLGMRAICLIFHKKFANIYTKNFRSDSSIFRDIQILNFFAPRVVHTNSEISFLNISRYNYPNKPKFYMWGSFMMLIHIKKKVKKKFFSKFRKKFQNFDFTEQTFEKKIVSKFVLRTSFRFSSLRQIEWRKNEDYTTNI